MSRLAIALLLLAAPAAHGQSITLPPTITINLPSPVGFIVVKATAIDADSVIWESNLPSGADAGLTVPLGTFISVGGPGTYAVKAIPIKAVKQADGSYKGMPGPAVTTTITVTGPTPPPPPTPPAPTDPLTATVQDAYSHESPPSTGLSNKKLAHQLSAVYVYGAELIVNDGMKPVPSLNTWADFFTQTGAAGTYLGVTATSLPLTQATLQQAAEAAIPDTKIATTPLTPASRAKGAEFCLRAAAALDSIATMTKGAK